MILYCTVLLNILPKFTILCSDHRLWKTVVRFTVHGSISLHSTLLSSTLLYCTLLHSTLLYSTLLCSTLLYSIALHSTLLYSTLLYFTVLYSIVVVIYVHHQSRDCSIDIPANALPCLMKQKMKMKNEKKKNESKIIWEVRTNR